jgi:CMP-N,N'-diacetyllegionaminic acid synthase
MIAIIPARSGSIGLKNKNIKFFKGRPLICHTIECARKSKYISRVIVSTDSKKISKIAKMSGAEIPFLRSKKLSSYKAKAIDVYIDVLNKIKIKEKIKINNFVVLQPTSPLRKSRDIDLAIELFNKKKAYSVISISKFETPLEWILKKRRGKIYKKFINLKEIQNRQSAEDLYIPNGAIYVFDANYFKNKKKYYSKKTYGYFMPKERSIDIDDILDFKLAEIL